ncbi:MAG TPA: hypothetical protein VEC36_04405 [Patescibacteria group bacterium]|nr:hypothetical protein [Patescibacteria group bacterium]
MKQSLTVEKALHQARKIPLIYFSFWAALSAFLVWGGDDPDYESFSLTCTFAIIGLVFFSLTFLKNKPRAKKTVAPESEVIVRWSYTPEEWANFTSAEAGFEKSEASMIGYGIGIVFAVLGMGAWIFEEENKTLETFIWAAAGSLLAGGALSWLTWMWFKVLALLRFVRYSQPQLPEALIMRDSMRIGSDEYRWNKKAGSYTLLGIFKNEKHGHPVLEFALHSTNNRKDVRVPIPAGREDEAQRVIERLHPGSK